jgi:magnesium-transporting ATPase (P-type)
LGYKTVNNNNRWFSWLIWIPVAVLMVFWWVWWIYLSPLPYTNPWRSLGLHSATLLGSILVWISNYYRRGNSPGRWWFWAYSVIVGFSIPGVIEDIFHVNHVKTLSPLCENALLSFGLLTTIGLGFLAQRR